MLNEDRDCRADYGSRGDCKRTSSARQKTACEFYGRGRWRKLKGFADIRLPDGRIGKAEIHWYEAHGIGRKEIKIKRLLD
jgi:hypothetical protein